MTGTGTQNDPYIVTTWDELVEKAVESGVYIKLGNDIDMNTEYPEGITSGCQLRCLELDGNNHTIKNISATDLSYVFTVDGSNDVTIKNTRFINMFLTANNSSLTFIATGGRKAYFYLCTLSGKFVGGSSYAYITSGYVEFTRCSLNIKSDGYFRTTSEGNWFVFSYTNAKFTGSYTGNLYFMFDNSYLTGEVDGSSPVWCVTGSANSVIDMVCPSVDGNSADHVLANSDKCSGTIQVATAVTTAQLADAAYLSSIGFPIQT